MNVNHLRAERSDHFAAADKMIRSAREGGKDLVGAELEQYEAHIKAIRDIDNRISRSAAFRDGRFDHSGELGPTDPGTMPGVDLNAMLGAIASPANGSTEWTDPRTGQPVAVLKPEQRMADLVQPSAYDEGPLSLGRYLRGIVTGKWRGAEREMQAMTEGTLGSGGYLLPSPLSTQIIDKVRNQAVLREM